MDREADHLIAFTLKGPIYEDARGYDQRETLLDVDVHVNSMHGAHVASVLLELLARRGPLILPLPPEEAAALAAEMKKPYSE